MSRHATIQDVDEAHRQAVADEIGKWRKDPSYIPIIDDMEMLIRLRTPYFDFGTALHRLKAGKRVTRLGWNGNRQPQPIRYSSGGVTLDVDGPEKFEPKMWVWLASGCETTHVRLQGDWFKHGLAGAPDGPLTVRPFICMRDAQGAVVPGWLASQTDMLAEDWVEVP